LGVSSGVKPSPEESRPNLLSTAQISGTVGKSFGAAHRAQRTTEEVLFIPLYTSSSPIAWRRAGENEPLFFLRLKRSDQVARSCENIGMIPESQLNVNALQIVRQLKRWKAYLVSQGNQTAVLKGEGALVGRAHFDDGAHRRANFLNQNQDTPQVKKSAAIISDILEYLTEDLGGMYSLRDQNGLNQIGTWAHKIAQGGFPDIAGNNVAANQQAEDVIKDYLWSVMEAYPNLFTLDGLERAGGVQLGDQASAGA
jgi:hypothetical protein